MICRNSAVASTAKSNLNSLSVLHFELLNIKQYIDVLTVLKKDNEEILFTFLSLEMKRFAESIHNEKMCLKILGLIAATLYTIEAEEAIKYANECMDMLRQLYDRAIPSDKN